MKVKDEIKPKGRPVPGYSLDVNSNKISDFKIKDWLMEIIAGEECSYGYHKMTACLRDERALIINEKKVYRLCKVLKILNPQKRKKPMYPRRLSQQHVITGPNQLWQMDIKYGYVAGYDKFFFLMSIIDVFDRNIVGHHLGKRCTAKDVCNALLEAMQLRSAQGEICPVIRTDNGPQFISEVFGTQCEQLKLIHERIPPKSPNLNAYIESYHAILERELFQKEEYMTFEDAFASVETYLEFYNLRRRHGSLRMKSPAKFLELWNKGEITPKKERITV